MSLTTALQSIESEDEQERESAIPLLISSESPEALVALDRVSEVDDNLQLRFMAKEGARQLRQRLSGTMQRPGASAEEGKLDFNRLKSRLSDKDPKRRLRGVRSALASKDKNSLKYLKQVLAVEKDTKVIVELCMTIGVLGGKGDSEGMLARLRDPDPEVRAAAIRGLAFLRDRSVYPTLVAMLQDKSRIVRARAFETLTHLGKPRLIRLLVRMLGSSRDWPRKSAVRACARINSSECAEVLIQARSRDPSPRIRREATKALVHLAKKGNQIAITAIEKDPPKELTTPLPSTAGLVIDRVAQQRGPVKPEENSAAQAEIARLQAQVAQAQAEAEAERARANSILSASESNPVFPAPTSPAPASPGVGSGSSSVSGNLPVPPLEILNLDDDDDPDQSELEDLELSTAEVMLGGLNDPQASVRLEHLHDILKQKDRSLAPQLAARLPLETDEKVLAKLILAIGKLGRKKDARRLLRYLDSNDKRIRANSVEALSMLGDPSSLRQAIPLLEDSDNRVRANAVVALKDLPDAEVVATLKSMAKHPETEMRLSAVYAALEIGTHDIDPILNFLLKDKEQEVKDKALSALTLLEDQRISPMTGKAFDPNDSLARIEKLSAWRGGAIDDDEEEGTDEYSDSVSQSASASASLDEEAQSLLNKLSGDTSTAEVTGETGGKAAKGWGRMPKSSVPQQGEAGGGGGLKEKWAQFVDYLSNPTPSKPQKPSASADDSDVSRRNVMIVLLMTVAFTVVIYSVFLGGGGADDYDVGDEF